MGEEEKSTDQYEEDISLKELFMAIWRQKLIIISITLIAAILTGIVSVFFISPVYNSRLNIIINMPDTYHTRFGDYQLPITSNGEYINLISSNDVIIKTINDMGYDPEVLTIEGLRERITIGNPSTTPNVEQNSFTVSLSADNPEEAKKLAQTLFDNYIEFIDVLTIKGAIDYYRNQFSTALKSLDVSLESTEKILAKNEELLAETPQTINQGEAMDEIKGNTNASEYIILENIINTNYIAIEKNIVENKQSINGIENSMRVYNEYLIELDDIQKPLDTYYTTGDIQELDDITVNITTTNIYLPSEPIVPSQKASPNNAMNVIIATVLGGMLGVLVALVKEYWFKEN
ncbi:MAG TPA: hypothetical protein GX731_05325 [Clostridiales bacterium]|nr:hypothetical protein [Clostridiales bacterium]